MNLTNDRHERPLRELLDSFESGSRPKGGVKSIREGVPSIGGEHLNRHGGFAFEKIKFVPEHFARSMTRGHLRQGDICVVKDGATTGKVSLVRQAFPFSDAVINEHVFRLQVKADHDPAYVFYYLFSANGQSEILSDFRGAAQGGISQGFVDKVFVPVVDRPKQERIVAEIEKQFTRLDAGVASLKRVHIALKRYRTSVLKAACEGRLVPTEVELARKENRSDETGEQLLPRILKERRNKWNGKGKYKEPAAPDIVDLPKLPEGWVWATAEQLSDATRPITYGVIKLGGQTESGVAILRSSDVRHLRLNLDGVKRIAPAIANEFRRTFLMGGEVLVTVRGTLGGVVVVPGECAGFNISREVAMIALVEPRLAPFVATMIAAMPLQNWLLSRTKGIAYTGINIETLKQLPIPLPPLAEQERIVGQVEHQLSLVQHLDSVVSDNDQRAARLRQSLLRQAFTYQPPA